MITADTIRALVSVAEIIAVVALSFLLKKRLKKYLAKQ